MRLGKCVSFCSWVCLQLALGVNWRGGYCINFSVFKRCYIVSKAGGHSLGRRFNKCWPAGFSLHTIHPGLGQVIKGCTQSMEIGQSQSMALAWHALNHQRKIIIFHPWCTFSVAHFMRPWLFLPGLFYETRGAYAMPWASFDLNKQVSQFRQIDHEIPFLCWSVFFCVWGEE